MELNAFKRNLKERLHPISCKTMTLTAYYTSTA